MQKNNIIDQNKEAINDFLFIYKEDTSKQISKFLFDLQGMFFTQSEVDYTDEYKSTIALHFKMLYDLVNTIEPV